MINILLSTYDFNNRYCFSRIKEYLKPNMKVVILPFSHDDVFYDREDYFNELYDYDFGFYEGLGFIEDKDIIVHWNNKDYQFDAIIYSGIRRDIDFILLEDGKCKIIKKEE